MKMIISPEEDTIELNLYFEVKDSVVYGGENTVGYANARIETKISSLTNTVIMGYAEGQKESVAKMCEVDIDKVKIISKEVYENETKEENKKEKAKEIEEVEEAEEITEINETQDKEDKKVIHHDFN